MSSNVTNQVAFLRTSREFPEDLRQLSVEAGKAYLDTANVVNKRIIGLFPTNRPAINGEEYYLTKNQKQQGFRQVYTFNAAGNIPHGIDFKSVSYMTLCFGDYQSGTDWYGVIFGTTVPIAGQVSFYVTTTDIVVLVDGAAPAITKGLIVLSWITNP